MEYIGVYNFVINNIKNHFKGLYKIDISEFSEHSRSYIFLFYFDTFNNANHFYIVCKPGESLNKGYTTMIKVPEIKVLQILDFIDVDCWNKNYIISTLIKHISDKYDFSAKIKKQISSDIHQP